MQPSKFNHKPKENTKASDDDANATTDMMDERFEGINKRKSNPRLKIPSNCKSMLMLL